MITQDIIITNFNSYKHTLKFDSNDYRLSLRHNLIKNIQVFDLVANSSDKKEINSLEFTAAFNFSKNCNGSQ